MELAYRNYYERGGSKQVFWFYDPKAPCLPVSRADHKMPGTPRVVLARCPSPTPCVSPLPPGSPSWLMWLHSQQLLRTGRLCPGRRVSRVGMSQVLASPAPLYFPQDVARGSGPQPVSAAAPKYLRHTHQAPADSSPRCSLCCLLHRC